MIYVFDVDNTLTPPREAMRPEFALQFMEFCRANTVYLVSGSDRGKLDKQLPEEVLLASAGAFTSAGSEFEVKGRTIYQHDHEFPDELIDWLDGELHNSRYPVRCGRHIEYRTGALNVSTVGRAADKPARKAYLAWDQVHRERAALCERLQQAFPDYEAHTGGEISIDISPLGWNKARILVPIRERHGDRAVTFFGDAIHPGGNDWPLAEALRLDSPCHVIVPVEGWHDTAEHMASFKPKQGMLSA